MTQRAGRLCILHIGTQRGWRGGDRQILWLASQLAGAGHTSIVAARPDAPLAARAAERGLRVVPCNPLVEFDPRVALALRRLVHHESVDIVHAHDSHAVTLAALATLRSRARMVLTRRVDFRLSRHPGTRWKYARADAIVAISSAVVEALVASGIRRDRIDLIPSGVDLSRTIEPVSRETLRSLGVPAGAPLVIQVAQLVEHKDPLTFVRAIAAARRDVPSLHGLLVGEGPLRAPVAAEIRRLGLEEALRLTGYREDADALLAAADVATLRSEEEGLGTVLLDALSVGTPVAATAAGGIPDIIRHGENGLLSPVHDPDALGASIARLVRDPTLARALATSGRARAAEFSVERTARLTAAVYARVRGAQPAGS